MEQSFEKLCSTSPDQLQRKKFLEPLAEKLNINHKNYKNRQSLCKVLIHTYHDNQETSLSNLSNSSDFATLDPLSTIESSRLVYWKQDSRVYASDIESMKTWIDKKNFISPYALDSASGILLQDNPDEYIHRFDLRSIPGFIDYIHIKWESLKLQKNFY